MKEENNNNFFEDTLQKWHSALLPLYSHIRKIENVKKLKSDDVGILMELLKEAGKSCQKVIDQHYEFKERIQELTRTIDELEKNRKEKFEELKTYEEKIVNLKSEEDHISTLLENNKRELEQSISNAYFNDQNNLIQTTNTEKNADNEISSDVTILGDEENNLFNHESIENKEISDEDSGSIVKEILSIESQLSPNMDAENIIDDNIDNINPENDEQDSQIARKSKMDLLLSALVLEINLKEQKSKEFSSRIEEKTYILERMEKYLNSIKDEIVVFENKFNNLSSQLEKYNNNIANTLSRIKAFQKEDFDSFKIYNHFKTSFKLGFDKLKFEISNSYKELRIIEDDISRKNRELEIIENNIRKEFPDYDLMIKNFSLKIENKDREINQLKKKISENEKIIINSEKNLKNSDESINNYKDNIEFLNNQVFELKNKLSQTEIFINDINLAKSKIETDYNLISKRNEEIVREYESIKEQIGDYENEVEKLRTQNDDLLKQLEENKNKSILYEQKYITFEEQIPEYEKQIADYKSQVEELNLKYNEIQESNIKLLKETEKYRKELTAIKNISEEKKESEQKVLSEMEVLTKRKNECERIILELEKINTSLAGQIRKRENLIQELEMENQQLSNELKDINDNKNL